MVSSSIRRYDPSLSSIPACPNDFARHGKPPMVPPWSFARHPRTKPTRSNGSAQCATPALTGTSSSASTASSRLADPMGLFHVLLRATLVRLRVHGDWYIFECMAVPELGSRRMKNPKGTTTTHGSAWGIEIVGTSITGVLASCKCAYDAVMKVGIYKPSPELNPHCTPLDLSCAQDDHRRGHCKLFEKAPVG